MKYYDTVKRVMRIRGGIKKTVYISRYICSSCNSVHRNLPKYLYPYKQYEKSIIDGVRAGTITPDVKEYEDYPCEMTMQRWISQK